jgi:hypothetical protein
MDSGVARREEALEEMESQVSSMIQIEVRGFSEQAISER